RNLTSLMDIISWLQGDVTLDLFEELLNPNICMLFQSLAFQNTDKICEIFSPVIPVADDETFPVLNKTNVSFGKHDYN
ncbi:hypothetical protein JW935_03750, partial [candidate division KSB1 bacterium]|nr:hypothetical protein [candidate division KSB1 bacterium]